MRRIPQIAVITVLGLAAASCGAGGSPPGSTLPPEPGPVLAAASQAMGSIDTVRFTIERTGDPVYIDSRETLAFDLAEGRFAAPSSAEAVVTLSVGDLKSNIGAIAINGRTWLTNPITGKWAPAPSGYSFDPAALFDPETGWQPLLATGLSDVEWIGVEDRPAGRLYHIRAVADGDRVAVILAGLIDKQEVNLDMWIDPASGHVVTASFSTTFDGRTSDWQIEFSDFGDPVEINPPDLE